MVIISLLGMFCYIYFRKLLYKEWKKKIAIAFYWSYFYFPAYT